MNLCECGHRSHDTWGCLTPECGCDTPWDKILVTAAERAERDRLLARIEAIPTHNDTPPTPDALNYAARHPALCGSWIFDVLTGLAALLAEERAQ